MPEIPEMERYRQLLFETVVGKQIVKVEVERPKSINVDVNEFKTSITGGFVEGISRRAKYLIIHLHGGLFLITHMMLDGRLYYGEKAQDNLPGTPHITFDFADGHSLYFCGLGLGFLHLVTREGVEKETEGIGIEPLSPEFTVDTLIRIFKSRRGVIKPLLMDQKLIAGIGNAYSNEILFASGILPQRKIPSLEESDYQKLWQVIPRILKKGIENGGYIEEPFAAWDNLTGGQNHHFLVYDRGGQPCPVCGTPINQTKLNGRWTYYCTVCQH